MKLPRFDATTAPTGTGLVRADPRAQTDVGDARFRGLQAAGAGLQSAGGSLAKIAQHKQKISDDTQTDRIIQNMQIWASEQEAAMEEMRIETPEDQTRILGKPGEFASGELWKSYNKMVEQEIKGASKGVQRNIRSLSSRMFPTVHDSARKITSAKFVDYTVTTETAMAMAEAIAGDSEASNERIDRLQESNVIGHGQAARIRASITRQKELVEKKRKIAAKEALVLQQEADKDVIGEAFQDGTIDYNMINDSSLSEDEQETYRVRMNTEVSRRLKGKPITTNQSVKGDIEAEGYKIWMGATEVDDYNDVLFNARYGKVVNGKTEYVFNDIVSDTPLIDDTAYDQLRTLGATELKTSQAKGLAETSFYAKGQLVEVTDELDFQKLLSGLDEPEKKQVQSERQIQLENWSQFNRSMKLWQAEHSDAVEGDYYIESRRKLPFYRSRVDEEVLSGVLPREGKKVKDPTDLSKMSDEDILKRIMQ